MYTQAQQPTEKIDKTEDTIFFNLWSKFHHKHKGKVTDWENVFEIHIMDKKLISFYTQHSCRSVSTVSVE